MYCRESEVTLEEGILFENFAKIQGGGVFGDTCHVTFDHNKLINNTALVNGGGMLFMTSSVDIHNTKGVNNTNNFAVITENSSFQSKYLHLPDAQGNCIGIFNDSIAEMKYTYLSNLQDYCPIVAMIGSKITVESVHFTDEYYSNKFHIYSNKSKYVVCRDPSSKAHGTFEGFFFFHSIKIKRKIITENIVNIWLPMYTLIFVSEKFPKSCITQCRCYSNRHEEVLVANCSYSGLTEVPDSLPEQTDWLLLSGNNISSLTSGTATNNNILYHLSHLDLYDNNVANISGEMIDGFILTNTLLYLDISSNQLNSLPDNIKNLTSLKTLKISGNKFDCTCKALWMKQWFLNETQIVENFGNIKCKMSSGKWIPVVHMDKADMGCVQATGEMFSIWKIAGKNF